MGKGMSALVTTEMLGFDFSHFFYSGVLILSIVMAVFDSTFSLV